MTPEQRDRAVRLIRKLITEDLSGREDDLHWAEEHHIEGLADYKDDVETGKRALKVFEELVKGEQP